MGQQEIRYTIEYEQEEYGRWLAELMDLRGVMAYGATPEDAIAKVESLALRVLADRIDHQEEPLALLNISFAAAAA